MDDSSEVKDLKEDLTACKNYLDMERFQIEILQKEILKLRLKIKELETKDEK